LLNGEPIIDLGDNVAALRTRREQTCPIRLRSPEIEAPKIEAPEHRDALHRAEEIT
jgi:hypothetical protein